MILSRNLDVCTLIFLYRSWRGVCRTCTGKIGRQRTFQPGLQIFLGIRGLHRTRFETVDQRRKPFCGARANVSVKPHLHTRLWTRYVGTLQKDLIPALRYSIESQWNLQSQWNFASKGNNKEQNVLIEVLIDLQNWKASMGQLFQVQTSVSL
jgi:hypothetical protein